MKKFVKGFGPVNSEKSVKKDIASRKKKKGGGLKNSIASELVLSDKAGFEAGNTTEFDSIDIKEKCLIKETNVDYGERSLFMEDNSNQTPKGLRLVTKKALEIIHASFISKSSLAQTTEKTKAVNILVNTNFKKSVSYSDQAVVVKEIPVRTLAKTVHAVLSEFGSVVSIKMQLVGLWQKTVMKFAQSDQADLVTARWFILIGKDAMRVAKANTDKESWGYKKLA
ncbi:hypothetical protein G9A89_010351 [Geosiphon pyriformis]|nr:hypothetical protein G9A89_010351 [Geosiphon pyriformis]